ncbi:MAG: hypothetical protein IPP71_05285 [Bacteroidetes bacterium]|nr:hypothetical protein [Bacteroidota bacterium]
MNDLLNTKLISTLSCFTPSEWRFFKNFLISGVAGPIGKSLEFYNLLTDYYPHFTHKDLNRNRVFKVLFAKQEYEDKKLRYVMTDLFKQASSFLKFNALKFHPEESNYLLTSELAKRGADKAFLASYKSEEGNSLWDADYYFNRYREDLTYLNLYLPRQKRSMEHPIAAIARNLDVFFVSRKLQLLCEIVNVRNVMSTEYDFILQEQIISVLKQGAFAEVPVIAIYFRIFMTLTEPDEVKNFFELKDLLSINSNLFKRDELRDMYQYLMNYCIKKINLGDSEYVKQLFKIYQLVIENKVLFTGDHLSQWDFKNIVVIGIRADEAAWVFDFIEEFKKHLLFSERENAYIYNMAYYCFSTGQYRKSLSLLRQVEFSDLYYQLDMRAILLKCYYEMDDQETFYYHTTAFKVFLSRNKLISDYQRVIYRNMIKYATRLMKSYGNKKQLEQLLVEIEQVKQIADINWLRKKIGETLWKK